MAKFRSEKGITQRIQKSGLTTFLVRIRTENGDITKSFNEKDFPSAKIAFESAVNFRNKTLYELQMGLYLAKNNSTVQDMFNAYLESTTDSYSTKRKHTCLFNKYVLHKETRMQDLTRADIQEDINRMVEIATDDTIAKVMSIWRNAIVNTALLKEIISRDLTLGVRKPESKMIHIKKDTTTDRETVNKVKALVRKGVRDPYNARIICFLIDLLYYTGMRPAEALALTRKDIKKNSISITKELGSSIDDTNVVRRCKTPNSIREIPIHQELAPAIEELLDYAERDELFLKNDGRYMDSNWVGNIIYRLCKKEGIEFNLYRMRHNMATHLVTNNVDSKTTVELLGHGNYDMSIYYANSNEELKKKAIKYLS